MGARHPRGGLAGPAPGVAELGPGVAPLLAASGGIALVGLVGDVRPLGVRVRLVAQAAAAIAVVTLAG